jgi:hypothetical protein
VATGWLSLRYFAGGSDRGAAGNSAYSVPALLAAI